VPIEQIPNHRDFMREIVWRVAAAAKKSNPHFIVLVRNAPELLITEKREWTWASYRDPDGAAAGKYAPIGSVQRRYLKYIDGMLIDGLYYGHDSYGAQTNQADTQRLTQAAKALTNEGRRVLTIEYAEEKAKVAQALSLTAKAKTLSYIDQDGDKRLGRIPKTHPVAENPDHITAFDAVRDWLPMFHSESFPSRDAWVQAMAATNYDLLLVHPFWRGQESLTKDDVAQLKFKALGTQRLVMATLPVGRASDAAWYWKPEWAMGDPAFLKTPSPDDPSQWIIEYWADDWKAIIAKELAGLMSLGFDGILLDQIDAYLYFEDIMPLD
jgi:endo-alpha-1,4-polygalactosaminidase (GH114 family)